MERRNFLKVIGSSFLFNLIGAKFVLPSDPKVLSVAEGKDYEKITKDAINAIGGISKFVKPDDVVVIKPNIGWDRTPEQSANTHPLVVKAIAEECIKAGAKRVKIFDRTCNDPRRCYETSGFNAVFRNMRKVELKHIEYERFKNVKLNGKFLKEWELYDEALNADVFINVPVAKHHGLTTLTLALKNVMGIMGGNRGYIHRDIETALADINSVVKSHLTIIDATRILLNHGPQGGDLKDVKVLNRVVASADIVLADAYATTFFGKKPEEISITVEAFKRGLGEMRLSNAKVIKV
ncbi:MAG: DUF362 domain-containing protein [Proteobacteria bacterium]|nr:DUF362 domain-containing protein [Pseudomonadota bacterium]